MSTKDNIQSRFDKNLEALRDYIFFGVLGIDIVYDRWSQIHASKIHHQHLQRSHYVLDYLPDVLLQNNVNRHVGVSVSSRNLWVCMVGQRYSFPRCHFQAKRYIRLFNFTLHLSWALLVYTCSISCRSRRT